MIGLRESTSSAPSIQAANGPQDALSSHGLSDPLQSVQLDVGAPSGASPEAVQQHAQAGVSGGGSAMPHLGLLQQSFGAFDIGHATAHTGAEASQANAAIGAKAYATGSSVAFSESSPDLHTVAHEAAHVVQQSGGVQLLGGVGAAGDFYEQHADQVADAVVRGDSAEPLLAQVASPGQSQGAGGAVQRIALDQLTPESTTGQYMVPGGSSEVLYGEEHATGPEPAGLYAAGTEAVTGGPAPATVQKWTPNVEFFTKHEQTSFTEGEDQLKGKARQRMDDTEGLGRFKKMWAQHKAKAKADHDQAALGEIWQRLIKSKEDSMDVLIEQGATMGLVGNNDCALFARALHQLIKAAQGDAQAEAPDGPEVGTLMQHKYPEESNGCGYHAVTVVAKDGASLVTLEAHAGRAALGKPTFEIRGGVDAFRNDNTPDGLSPEKQQLWEDSTVRQEHVKGPQQQHLGGSVDEMRENFGSATETHQDIGLRMMKMGLKD